MDQHLETIASASKQAKIGQTGQGLKKLTKEEEEKEPKRVYTINKKSRRTNPYFNWEENIYALDLHKKDNKTFDEAVNDMKLMFEQLYNDFVKNVAAQDRVKMTFEHDLFKSSVWLPFMKPSDYSPDLIMNTFDRIVQSYKLGSEVMQEKHRFTAKVSIMHLPVGSGKRICKEKRDMTSLELFLNETKSVKVVKNVDSLCLLRAVILARAYDAPKITKQIRNMYQRQETSSEMKSLLVELCRGTGIWTGPCGIEEIKKIEDYLGVYQIMVIDGNGFNKEPIYLNKDRQFSKYLYLALHDGHYYAITSIKVFFGHDYYCDVCKIPYSRLGSHQCNQTCRSCLRLGCLRDEGPVDMCKSCNKPIYNEVCARIHKESVCTDVTVCKKCKKSKHKYTQHVCENQKFCQNCKMGVELDHRCYILTEGEKQQRCKQKYEIKFEGYIFFDYETYRRESDGVHVPNLVIAKQICVDCLNSTYKCAECSITYKFYNNIDFCVWLFKKKHFTALAHNLKGYDGVFIANYCINDMKPTDGYPDMIATPTKLLQIKFRQVKIIDSLSFLAMALESFPKTFDIPEMKKGFYPHMFNTPDKADYVGFYPEKSYYGHEYFSIRKKEEFDKFYASNKHKIFNQKDELESYCISDVNILMEGCLKFRTIVMEQTKLNDTDIGVDPFRVAITMASLCNHIYRRNFMEANSIAVIPENGYNPKQNSSKKALQWLNFIASNENIFIQSNGNTGEYRVGPYHLDGICETNKTIYEFYGCYWHGCKKCFSYGSWNSTRNYTMGYLHFATMERHDRLRRLMPGYRIVEKWECEFDAESKQDIHFGQFISNNTIIEALKPRDALYGGRTNAFQLYYKCKANEKIKYYDFTSLYPAVQKQEVYPIGHPEVLTSFENNNVSKFFGLIKCKVIPPARLYAPVLPARINSKLVFTLCQQCALDQDSVCKHNDSKRAITGTWPTIEINKALEKAIKSFRFMKSGTGRRRGICSANTSTHVSRRSKRPAAILRDVSTKSRSAPSLMTTNNTRTLILTMTR